MEDKISVNEYVRTKNKGIRRIDRIDNNKTVNKYLYFTGIEDSEGKEYGIIKTTEIVKHSKQLIDLIEVGDIVNGFPVLEPIYNGNAMYGVDEGYENFKKSFGGIKTILTREQYIANCYKVGGEDEC
jgi:hypothetical protein